MERFEEFAIDGKSFLYADFSGLDTADEIVEAFAHLNSLVQKYPESSLNLISNVENLKFDSKVNRVAEQYTALNFPYVRYDVIIGTDGIRRMLARTLMKLAGRKNFHFCYSKEEAIDWLLKQD